MTLFVDETENEDFFIVTGLLVRSKEDVDLAYRKFKKGISGAHISNKLKQSLFTEFKSVQLDHHFQALKKRMLLEIMEFDNSIIYSCHVKKDKLFYQKKKEDVYQSERENLGFQSGDEREHFVPPFILFC